MKFKMYMEGQAIQITADMKNFADESQRKYYESEDSWSYGKPINSRLVDGGRYGKRTVSIVPDENKEGNGGFATADVDTGIIYLFVKHGNNYGDAISNIIKHELVHIFDPKINDKNLINAKWGIESYVKSGKPLGTTGDSNVDQVYYTNPWEQDAYMSADANARLDNASWLFDNDWNDIQPYLRKIRPETAQERSWYANPKMWRKFLNTIYQEMIRRKK